MSGHSKWSQIKRQKGTTDAKRAQAFTKLAKAIMVAVAQNGVGDPEQNFKLRLLMDKARAINMPKDNIERAIDKGLGKGGKGDVLDEVVYEGFAPGGVAFIVEALTDNKQRTTPQVKSVIEKNGGTLGNPGSVAYQFHTKGEILVVKSGKTLDDIFIVAVDKGAEDIEEVGDDDGHVLISTTPEALGKVREALVLAGVVIAEAELVRKPITTVLIENVHTAQSVLSFMDKLENLDDVQKVYTNCDIPEHLLDK